MGLARPARCRAAGGLLPRHFTLAGANAGGMFLLRFPSGCPARVLPGILARRSPDFPPRLRGAAARLPVRLISYCILRCPQLGAAP